MTTFDRREEAFESLFAHDEAMRFRAEARRAKALAAWAAEQNGRAGADKQAYTDEIVAFTTLNGGDDALFQRLRADLGGGIADAALRERMTHAMAEALRHVKTA